MSKTKQYYVTIKSAEGMIVEHYPVNIPGKWGALRSYERKIRGGTKEGTTYVLTPYGKGKVVVAYNHFKPDGSFMGMSVAAINNDQNSILTYEKELAENLRKDFGDGNTFLRVETVPPDTKASNSGSPAQQSGAQPWKKPLFKFKFEFVKEGTAPRTEEISTEGETREYAWRAAVEIAQKKAKQGETAIFVGDVVKKESAGN